MRRTVSREGEVSREVEINGDLFFRVTTSEDGGPEGDGRPAGGNGESGDSAVLEGGDELLYAQRVLSAPVGDEGGRGGFGSGPRSSSTNCPVSDIFEHRSGDCGKNRGEGRGK